MTTSETKKLRFEPRAPPGFKPGTLRQIAVALPLAPPPLLCLDHLLRKMLSYVCAYRVGVKITIRLSFQKTLFYILSDDAKWVEDNLADPDKHVYYIGSKSIAEFGGTPVSEKTQVGQH